MIYDKASLVHIPSGVNSGTLYNVLPNTTDGDFDFTRGSTATRVNKDGLIETVASDVPRLDYPLLDGVVQDCPALLLEPSRTNSYTYSEDFSQTFWKKGAGLTITLNNAVSPDGSQTATKIQKTSQDYLFLRAFFAPAIVGTLSVFVKKGNYRYVGIRNNETAGTTHSVFDFDTETFVTTASNHSLSFVKHENGWYRLIDYVSVDDNSNYQGIAITDVLGNEISTDIPLNSYVYVWGAQYEQNQSYPTSYIPTQGSAVTRSADVCSQTVPDGVIGQTEGVVYMDFIAQNTTGQSQSHFWLGASGNEIGLYGGAQFIFYSSGGVSINGGNIVTGQRYKVAFGYKANDYVAYINGTQVGTDTSATVPTMSGLALNSYFNGTEVQKKNISDFKLYNTRLSNTELQALTT